MDDDDDVNFSFKSSLSNHFRGRTPSFYKQTLPPLSAISQCNLPSHPKNTSTSITYHPAVPLSLALCCNIKTCLPINYSWFHPSWPVPGGLIPCTDHALLPSAHPHATLPVLSAITKQPLIWRIAPRVQSSELQTEELLCNPATAQTCPSRITEADVAAPFPQDAPPPGDNSNIGLGRDGWW